MIGVPISMTPMIPAHRSGPANRGRLLGISEVADMFGVRRDTVDKWRTRDVLPEPDADLHAGPVWWETTLIRWARRTGREIGRPPGPKEAPL